jgi:DNA-binding transcriptional MocR family regulator
MLAALQETMPEGVTWTRPEGGMFVWLTLPKDVDGAKLLTRALESENIAFVPGQAFYADGAGRNTLRLSFSVLDEADIRTGIARLARLLRQG